jgi:hypothetical protein
MGVQHRDPKRRGRRLAVLALTGLAVAGLAAGCGQKYRENQNRPPQPLMESISIVDDKLTVSEKSFGAGPTWFTISNQHGGPVTVKVEGAPGINQVGPILDRNPGQLQVTLDPGSYQITATGDRFIKPAKIKVGEPRPSAQNQLLRP